MNYMNFYDIGKDKYFMYGPVKRSKIWLHMDSMFDIELIFLILSTKINIKCLNQSLCDK